MRGKAGKYRHRRQAMNTFSPCCISDAPLILRESLEASTFWWMTGPLVADPETSTWDSRAGGWKQNNRLADVSALLLGSTRLCIYNIAAWKLLPQACSGTTGCWWYILTVMEPLFFSWIPVPLDILISFIFMYRISSVECSANVLLIILIIFA